MRQRDYFLSPGKGARGILCRAVLIAAPLIWWLNRVRTLKRFPGEFAAAIAPGP